MGDKVKKTEYILLPNQYKFLYGFDENLLNKDEVYTDVAAYIGGVGSGKTFCGSLRGLTFALNWAGCKGLVGAMSEDLLNSTTKQKYVEHLENIGFKEGVHWWYEDRRSVIRLINGSSIKFKTLSDWRQFMSTEFTWIEFEEASFIDEITFKKLLTRLREFRKADWKDYYRSMFLHTNPQGRRGWIYKFFRNKNTKIPSYRCITASTRENHHLGNSYVELLEDLYSAEEISEMIDGLDLDNDNTVAFPYFTQANIKQGLDVDKSYPVILTCDFNYNPMCWYIVQEREGKWYIIKELIEQNILTSDMSKIVVEYLRDKNVKSLTIMGDAHGRDKKTNGSDYGIMLSTFSDAGIDCILRVQKANPRIKERLSILRGTIRNAKGEVSLFVDESCKKLIYNFEEAKNNLATGGLREPTDKEIQDDDKKKYLIHPIDAISYPIHFERTFRDITNT